MALLAAATFGPVQFGSIRAQVSVEPGQGMSDSYQGGYRLIVQSYDERALATGRLPTESARPLASTQRAITAEELKRGVLVNVVQLDEDATGQRPSVVLAWVEPGPPNLEFDALLARPGPEAFYGSTLLAAHTGAVPARIVLSRQSGTA
jgi:hypothetical protein